MTHTEKAREIIGAHGLGHTCSCEPAYNIRGRTDPQCFWCSFGRDLVSPIVQALEAAEKQGYDRGIAEGVEALAQLRKILDRYKSPRPQFEDDEDETECLNHCGEMVSGSGFCSPPCKIEYESNHD